MSHRAAIALAAVTALVPAPARADDATRPPGNVPPRARELAARGQALHAAGNYDAAIAAFTEAYALAPTPALVFDLAQAYRLGGHCDDAAVMYRRFLATSPDADTRALAQELLAAMERCAATQQRPSTAPITVAPAVTTVADVAQPVMATSVVDTAHHDGRTAKRVGLGLVGAGVFGLGVATYYGASAQDAAEAVSTAYAHGAAWSSLRDTDAAGRRDATVAVAAALTGAAAIAAGVTLYVHGRNQERAVVVMPALHGAEVHATWRF